MFKLKLNINILLFGLFLSVSSMTIAGEAETVLIKSEEYRGFGQSYGMSVKITDVNAGSRQQSEYEVLIKDSTTTLVVQTAPVKAKGRKMLMIKNDLWLYTPDIKKPIRVNLAQKLTGETANGDITKTDFLNDYKPSILARDKSAIKLKLTSVNEAATYDQIIYYVNAKDFKPIKAEFMAKSGKHLKTAYYGQFKKFKDRTLLTEIKIVDALRNNRFSLLKYEGFEPRKMDDSIFNKASF